MKAPITLLLALLVAQPALAYTRRPIPVPLELQSVENDTTCAGTTYRNGIRNGEIWQEADDDFLNLPFKDVNYIDVTDERVVRVVHKKGTDLAEVTSLVALDWKMGAYKDEGSYLCTRTVRAKDVRNVKVDPAKSPGEFKLAATYLCNSADDKYYIQETLPNMSAFYHFSRGKQLNPAEVKVIASDYIDTRDQFDSYQQNGFGRSTFYLTRLQFHGQEKDFVCRVVVPEARR